MSSFTRAGLAGLAVALTPGCGSDAPEGNVAAPVANAAAPAPAAPVDVAALAAAGDPAAGRKSFGQCMACHSAEPGKTNPLGPHLAGIVGQRAATHSPGFAYSPALRASKLVWDGPTLDAWIEDPLAKVPGTNMHFLGVPRKPVRTNIIAYLATTTKR